jgi:hypothetical protein
MRRRDFVTLIVGAAAWPLAARAQQPAMPVIGVLRPNRQHVVETFAEPFRRYMKAIGWEEGRNIRFLFAWTEGRNERAPATLFPAILGLHSSSLHICSSLRVLAVGQEGSCSCPH